MKTSSFRTILIAGAAIFSMFFGAGNVIFPLKIGLLTGESIAFALVGLLLTAIGGPLLGLIGATLYKGDCLAFFCRPGKSIGIAFISLSLFLLGPFAVIPRCFVVAHSSIHAVFEGVDLFTFSLFFGAISLLGCLRKSLVLPILGKVLSPLLLLSLICIIVAGIQSSSPAVSLGIGPLKAFYIGLQEGFNTMDLIAAIFFSASIWNLLFLQIKEDNDLKIAKTAITSGLIGGALLGLTYVGLGLAAANHYSELSGISPEQLMSSLAVLTLGPVWGNLANLAIILACFTTVVSLTQTIAELLQTISKKIYQGGEKKSFLSPLFFYRNALIAIVLISVVFANLGFANIQSIIHPAIAICYPAIIVLAVFNVLYKLFGFEMIKRPVYCTLFSSTLLKSVQLLGGF